MRTQIIPNIATFKYPDKWCFAYNSQKVIIETPSVRNLVLRFSDTSKPSKVYDLRVSMISNRTEVDITQPLQMLTPCNISKRWAYIHVAILVKNVSLASFHLYSLYGHIKEGEYFSSYGSFITKENMFRRRVVWFKNYPFSVSFFRRSVSEHISCSIDGNVSNNVSDANYNLFDIDISGSFLSAKQNIRLIHHKAGSTLALFDNTFDHTFTEEYLSMMNEAVDVTVNDATEGYYIRWIDNFGYIQYYLFSGVNEELKNTNSSITVDTEHETTRPIETTTVTNVTCAAVSISPDIIYYVSSIVKSPCVQLYNNGVWEDINITGDTVKYKSDKVLQDVEIHFEIKQTLQTIK